jgi:hypothetical protein
MVRLEPEELGNSADSQPAVGRKLRQPEALDSVVLCWPAGTWIVGLAGVALCGIGLYQGYRGISHDFLKDSKT